MTPPDSGEREVAIAELRHSFGRGDPTIGQCVAVLHILDEVEMQRANICIELSLARRILAKLEVEEKAAKDTGIELPGDSLAAELRANLPKEPK